MSDSHEHDITVRGTLRKLYGIFTKQSAVWKDQQFSVILCGPWWPGTGPVTCLLRLVPHETGIPNEHAAEIRAVEVPAGPEARTSVRFLPHDFPDRELFKRAVDALIATLKQEGLEPEAAGGIRLPDKEIMRKYYKDHNEKTAREILDALPGAWEGHTFEGGRWGPGRVARVMTITATTVGRYFKAFWHAGLTEVDGIRIPYRPITK